MHKDVDAFLGFLPDHLVPVGEKLREIIFDIIPEVEEKFSFHTPFYHYYGMFAYLSKVKDGIEICLCRGKDLTWEFPQLQMKKRVMVAGVTACTMDDIRTLAVRDIIAAAAAWQKQAWLDKKAFVKQKKNIAR